MPADPPRPPSATTRAAQNAVNVAEPDWDTISPQQVQQIYTSAGLALYNYLKWGVQELVNEAHEGFRDLDLSSSLAELRSNFYAARAHWRSGAKKTAARLMWRTSKLALQQHVRIMELGAQEPALLRRLNSLGLRGYAEQIGRAIEATARGVQNVATAAGAGLGIVLVAAAVLFFGNKS